MEVRGYVRNSEKIYAGENSMLDRSDIQGRLRLLRYGLLVVVTITFLVSLLAPMLYLNSARNFGIATPPFTDFLGTAIILTIVVAIIAVGGYAVYHYILTKTWP